MKYAPPCIVRIPEPRALGLRSAQEEELSDVLKGKSDTVVFCDLSQVQRDLYRNTLSLPELQLLKR